MKLLILTKVYSVDGENPWLIEDLAKFYSEDGHTVTVLHYDIFNTASTERNREMNGVLVCRVPVVLGKRYLNWIPSRLFVAWSLVYSWCAFFSEVRKNNYDLVINFTMFSYFAPIHLYLRNIRKIKTIGLVWDYYPVHWVEIGQKQNSKHLNIIRWLERRLFLSVDKLCFMSEANLRFCRRYHEGTEKIASQVIGLWRNDPERSLNVGLRAEKSKVLRVVFGGQISKGRGFEQILETAKHLANYPIEVSVIGDGPLWSFLKEEISQRMLRNVKLIKKLPRSDYIDYLQGMDIGLVVTVADVSIPSFPSKCLDYMSLGKPIVASVEKSSDFGEFVQKTSKCGVSCDAGDDRGMAELILEFLDKPEMIERLGRNGRNYYLQNMRTEIVAHRIIDA